jgi:hypothetical protein
LKGFFMSKGAWLYDGFILIFVLGLLFLYGCTGAELHQGTSGSVRSGQSISGDLTNADISSVPPWMVVAIVGLIVLSAAGFFVVSIYLASHHATLKKGRVTSLQN